MGPFGFDFAGLNLDETQKAKIKEIMKEARQNQPGSLHAQMRNHRMELKALLSAPQVNATSLNAWLSAREADWQKALPARMDLAVRLREVLTPAQREQLAGKLESRVGGAEFMATQRQRMRERIIASLSPTEAQKAKIQALSQKVDAWQSQASQSKSKALAAFVRNGQKAELAAAFVSPFSQGIPKAELIEVATSLDLKQRQQLMQMMDRRMGGGRRPHGPRGHGRQQPAGSS